MADLTHLLCRCAILFGSEEPVLHGLLAEVAPFALLALVDCE
jgi:hypothetical protein